MGAFILNFMKQPITDLHSKIIGHYLTLDNKRYVIKSTTKRATFTNSGSGGSGSVTVAPAAAPWGFQQTIGVGDGYNITTLQPNTTFTTFTIVIAPFSPAGSATIELRDSLNVTIGSYNFGISANPNPTEQTVSYAILAPLVAPTPGAYKLVLTNGAGGSQAYTKSFIPFLIGNVQVNNTIGISNAIILDFSYTYSTVSPINYTPRVYVNFQDALLPNNAARAMDINLNMQNKFIALYYYWFLRNETGNFFLGNGSDKNMVASQYPIIAQYPNINTDADQYQSKYLLAPTFNTPSDYIFEESDFIRAQNNLYFESCFPGGTYALFGQTQNLIYTLNTTDTYKSMASFVYAELQNEYETL